MQGTRASQTWSLLQNTAINLVSCIAPMANTLGTAHLTTSSMSKLKTQTWMSLHKHRTRSNAFSPPSFRFGAFLRKAQQQAPGQHRSISAPRTGKHRRRRLRSISVFEPSDSAEPSVESTPLEVYTNSVDSGSPGGKDGEVGRRTKRGGEDVRKR